MIFNGESQTLCECLSHWMVSEGLNSTVPALSLKRSLDCSNDLVRGLSWIAFSLFSRCVSVCVCNCLTMYCRICVLSFVRGCTYWHEVKYIITIIIE